MARVNKVFWHFHENDEYISKIRLDATLAKRFGLPSSCDECGELIGDDLGYDCNLCNKEWHIDCIPSSPDDINHPFHPYHPLKLLNDGPGGTCVTCHNELMGLCYHCSICNFIMHARCSKNPPPLTIDAPKCHEHILTLMARNDTFTCNACGMHGEQCPYVCAPCALMFHIDCIKLPHVININRHDHRISHTYSLGFGDWKCMICHKKIDWRYGAYCCSTCPDGYVVHSKCATRNDVWDGIELEGIPEEFVDVSPFTVVEEGVINHFSHKEHNLKIVDVIDGDGTIRCEACVHPIYYEKKHYSCMTCKFILHETCANLPLQKRHWLSTKPFSLNPKKDDNKTVFVCGACETFSNGFTYESGEISLDMRCATISWYCDYECHPHILFLTTLDEDTCGGCNLSKDHVLRCRECDFSLCFACATLPKKIKHKGDEQFLLLRFGEKASGKYWCEVCESIIDPQKWFYTSDESGITCHIKCVIGEFPNAEPGVVSFPDEGKKIELVSNDRILRPKCASCSSRCIPPLIIKFSSTDTNGDYCCDFKCLFELLKRKLL